MMPVRRLCSCLVVSALAATACSTNGPPAGSQSSATSSSPASNAPVGDQAAADQAAAPGVSDGDPALGQARLGAAFGHDPSASPDVASPDAASREATSPAAARRPASPAAAVPPAARAPTAAPAAVPPASCEQILAQLDLRSLPKLTEVRPMRHLPTAVEYYAQGRVSSAVAFYQAELRPLGWKPVMAEVDGEEQVPYRELLFARDGYYLKLTVGQANDPDTVTLQLQALGNVDARTLPAVEGAESIDSGLPSSASYVCSADMATIVGQTREVLARSGWHEYADFGPSLPGNPQFVSLSLVQNGVLLFVFVSSTPQVQNGRPMITYTLSGVLPFDIPIVDGADQLKLSTHDGRAEYVSHRPVSETVQWYRDAYRKLGWMEREDSRKVESDSGALLAFDAPGDASAVLRVLTRQEGGFTVAIDPLAKKREKPAQPSTAEAGETTAETTKGPASSPAQPAPVQPLPGGLPEADRLLRESLKQAGDDVQKALGDLSKELDNLPGFPGVKPPH